MSAKWARTRYGMHDRDASARRIRAASRKSARYEDRFRGNDMTILDQVRALIERLSPEPVCDDCIAERLGLGESQHASIATRELAGQGGFERRKDVCSLCGATKEAIRRAAH